MIAITLVALTYGVSLAVEQARDTVVTLFKDEKTGEMVANVINYFINYCWQKTKAVFAWPIGAVAKGGAAVGREPAAAWDTIVVWRR